MSYDHIIRYYVNGGGTSKYDRIAHELGWRIGINSGSNSSPTLPIKMLDNDWLRYDHKRHLAKLKRYRPELVTVQDIECLDQIDNAMHWGHEFLEYANKIILIPKIDCTDRIYSEFPLVRYADKVLLGYSVGRFEINDRRHYTFAGKYQVHLLGGSFKRLHSLIKEYKEVIHSLDSNYASRIAQYGKIDTVRGTAVPTLKQVENGKDYNYRCFQCSLKEFDIELAQGNRQLSLF